VLVNVAPLFMESTARTRVRTIQYLKRFIGQVSSNVLLYLLFILFLVGLIIGIFFYTKKIKEENARSVSGQPGYGEDRDPSVITGSRSGAPNVNP
jgi:hypothetical protein